MHGWPATRPISQLPRRRPPTRPLRQRVRQPTANRTRWSRRRPKRPQLSQPKQRCRSRPQRSHRPRKHRQALRVCQTRRFRRQSIRHSYTATGNTQLAVTDLPDGLQTVTARWYRGGGRLILVYQGLDLSVSGPVCPGNSIFTTQFEFISNSPTAPGACDGDPSGSLALAGPDAGVRICAGLVSYITEIPDDIAGVVFATINLFPDTGPALGITVSTPTSAGIPEIDPSILSC